MVPMELDTNVTFEDSGDDDDDDAACGREGTTISRVKSEICSAQV